MLFLYNLCQFSGQSEWRLEARVVQFASCEHDQSRPISEECVDPRDQSTEIALGPRNFDVFLIDDL